MIKNVNKKGRERDTYLTHICRHPITTLVDCKSFNLVYKLQSKKCNAFYIGETVQMLSIRVNGHWSSYKVVNSDLSVTIHTQSHQLPLQECWPFKNSWTPPPTMSPANLKRHINLYLNPINLLVSIFDSLTWSPLPLLPFFFP